MQRQYTVFLRSIYVWSKNRRKLGGHSSCWGGIYFPRLYGFKSSDLQSNTLAFNYPLTNFSWREQELVIWFVIWGERVVLPLLSLSLLSVQFCLFHKEWPFAIPHIVSWVEQALFLSQLSIKKVLRSHVISTKAGGFLIHFWLLCFSFTWFWTQLGGKDVVYWAPSKPSNWKKNYLLFSSIRLTVYFQRDGVFSKFLSLTPEGHQSYPSLLKWTKKQSKPSFTSVQSKWGEITRSGQGGTRVFNSIHDI